jgi:hypothetical protein
MALIIEDGSVVADADSFIDVADARTKCANYGLSISDDDTEAEVQLRQAYVGLIVYEPSLQGYRVSSEQTGIFPRYNVEKNCFAVDSDVIPPEVVMAQLYQADAVNSGSYNNNSTSDGEKLSSFEVVGAYKESYQDDSSTYLNSLVQGVVNSLYPFTEAASCGGGYGNGVGREGFGFVGH